MAEEQDHKQEQVDKTVAENTQDQAQKPEMIQKTVPSKKPEPEKVDSGFVIGQHISIRKSQDVPLSFKGTITKIYENSALVTIDTYDEKYEEVAADLQNKTVVGFKHIHAEKQN